MLYVSYICRIADRISRHGAKDNSGAMHKRRRRQRRRQRDSDGPNSAQLNSQQLNSQQGWKRGVETETDAKATQHAETAHTRIRNGSSNANGNGACVSVNVVGVGWLLVPILFLSSFIPLLLFFSFWLLRRRCLLPCRWPRDGVIHHRVIGTPPHEGPCLHTRRPVTT